MPWYLDTTVYELKGNLSRFVRALMRGDADLVVVKRYGRPVTLMASMVNHGRPAREPETEDDRAMRARTYYRHDAGEEGMSRRPPPPPELL